MNRGRLAAFDLRGRHRPRPGAGPLAIVCGLPVLVRNLLLIERAGFRRALILADPIDRSLAVSALEGARRLAIECVWIDDAGDSLGPVLAAVPPGGAEVLYWPGELSCGRFLPDLATADIHPDGALVEHVSAGAARPGLILFGARALSAIRNDTAAQLVANLDRQGRVVVAPAAPQVVAVSRRRDRPGRRTPRRTRSASASAGRPGRRAHRSPMRRGRGTTPAGSVPRNPARQRVPPSGGLRL